MSLPFTELSIHSFRGLRDVVLRELGRVNVFVGPNNSGKTSVLEALELAADPLSVRNWIRTATQREPFSFAIRSVQWLRWLFPHDVATEAPAAYQGQIEISTLGGAPFRRVRASYQDLRSLRELPSPTDEPPTLSPRSFEQSGVRLDVDAFARSPDGGPLHETFEWWEDGRNLLPSAPTTSTPLQVVTAHDHLMTPLFATQYSEARRRGSTDNIIELLALIDRRITGLEILEGRRSEAALYVRDASAGLLPLDAFGDGIRRILLIAFAITFARNGVLLIDELETAIHISALGRAFRWMIRACEENNVQLFVTTHSLEAIDALIAADDTPAREDIVGYRLEANGSSVTAKRYGEDLLRRLRMERGLEVR